MTVTTRSKAHKSTAPIKRLPIDIIIMIIEKLRWNDALNLCDALPVPEQVGWQYFDYEQHDIGFVIFNIQVCPNPYKFLSKNKSFQIKASSSEKTMATLRTKDLEFVKKYIEEAKPNLNRALSYAANIGYTNAVKLLLSDSRVDSSAKRIERLISCVRQNWIKEVLTEYLEKKQSKR
jgi:hypothetical protein